MSQKIASFDILQNTPEIHTFRFKTGYHDCDSNGYLHTAKLLDYFQLAAGHHADHLGVGFHTMSKKNYAWILTRQAIECVQEVSLDEDLYIFTFPSQVKTRYSKRLFAVYNARKELIAHASTLWMVIDKTQRTLVPLTEFTDKISLADIDKKGFIDCKKAGKISEITEEISRDVYWSELDINEHVNHTNYLKWALDHYRPDHFKNKRLTEIQINYLSESFWSENIRTIRSSQSEKADLFSIRTGDGNEEKCRLALCWTDR